MPTKQVSVKILRNTRVKGEQVLAMVGAKGKEKRNVVSVDEDTARLLIASGKAEYGDPPKEAKEPANAGRD